MSKTIEERVDEVRRETEEKVQRIQEAAVRHAERREQFARSAAAYQRAAHDLRVRLEAEFSMTDHPKRDLLWSKAWEHGHSNGHEEVEYWYGEFVEMIQ